MIKTLRTVMKEDREKFKIPKSIQQVIPIRTLWEDGIFLVGKNKYSKSYKFSDINFSTASLEDKKTMFFDWSAIINYFDTGATTKITIAIRKMNMEEFKETILYPMTGDGLDELRGEVNDILLTKVKEANGLVRELYITTSVCKKNIEEARNYYRRVGAGLISHFSDLGSVCVEMGAKERLHVLHDFYREGEEGHFQFDPKESAKRGHDFKDYICPDSMEFYSDYFQMGERYGRVLYMKEYASYIKDDLFSKFSDINRNMIISMDIIPAPMDEAVREVENRLLGVETNITNWQRRQNANQNYSATVPYDMEMQRKESKDFMHDLTSRDQRMTFSVLTLVHTADTKAQLDADTEALIATARGSLCQMAILKYQQMDGLNTVLPIGVRKIDALRTLTTESLAILIPFRVQEVMDIGGIYCGVNAVSNNIIMVNRANLLNPSCFVLGVPGSGKSMTAKILILLIALGTKDQILIYDPEGEYTLLIEALGGISLPIYAGSDVHVNAMDMVKGYGEKNPVIEKSQFILSLYERISNGKVIIGPQEKSILDRCVDRVYKLRDNTAIIPSFKVLRQVLMEQEEIEAKDLALMLELFTDGTLDIFSHPTNIDLNNRMISFNTRDMGEELKALGQLIITDQMINRVSTNWENGVRTHIFLDEFHTLLEQEYSANFFDSAYRRFRKRDAWVSSLTQNVEYVLNSLAARTMLSNSEFIIMLNQSESDRKELAALLHISDEQTKFITNARIGCGLLRVGSALVPFQNQIPSNTKLYKLMTTKPGE